MRAEVADQGLDAISMITISAIELNPHTGLRMFDAYRPQKALLEIRYGDSDSHVCQAGKSRVGLHVTCPRADGREQTQRRSYHRSVGDTMGSADSRLETGRRAIVLRTLSLPISRSVWDSPKVSRLVQRQPKQPRLLVLVELDDLDHTSGGFLSGRGNLEGYACLRIKWLRRGDTAAVCIDDHGSAVF